MANLLRSHVIGVSQSRQMSDLVAAFQQLSLTVRKYNPGQPRVPAGEPNGGQWAPAGAGAGDGGAQLVASRRVSRSTEMQCDLQYQRDIFQCAMVSLRSCYQQAAARYAACLRGDPIPPLNY